MKKNLLAGFLVAFAVNFTGLSEQPPANFNNPNLRSYSQYVGVPFIPWQFCPENNPLPDFLGAFAHDQMVRDLTNLNNQFLIEAARITNPVERDRLRQSYDIIGYRIYGLYTRELEIICVG